MVVALALLASVAAAAQEVVRWQPGGETSVVGKDEFRVLTAGNVTVRAALVDVWKDSTAARLQLANMGSEDISVPPEAVTLEMVKPKPNTVAAVPADKLAKKIQTRYEQEAVMAEQQGMKYAMPTGAGEHDERNRLRQEGMIKSTYIQEAALPATIGANQQVAGQVYFPYQKKREEMVLRVRVGATTFEFPFTKNDVKPAQ